MIITLPLPHKYLSPNYRVNHQGKARVVKKYREDAYIAAIHAGAKDMRLESATVQCKFFFRTIRTRDGDNLLGSLKSGFDGLVDAGVFTDDRGLSHLPVEYEKDARNPRVEIHILTMTDAEMDRIYDAIDQMMRDGDFKKLNGLLSDLSIIIQHTEADKALTYLTATLPAKSKLRARKKLLDQCRSVFVGQRDLFKGLD